MRLRTYRELRRLPTLLERFEYLSLKGTVAAETFGFDRWMNQGFYRSSEWRNIRHHIIARDLGCDMGVPDHEIHDRIYVHHMNPLTQADITNGDPSMIDPEFLICVTHRTHNAIHYGSADLLPRAPIERRAGDTTLWR